MSTQYNKIGAAYAEMKKLPGAILESANVAAALRPMTQNAKVFDLACGMGRYSRPLVSEWGASYVLGVDISSVMVEEGRKAVEADTACRGKVEFEVRDCTKPHTWPQGPFDVVLASWTFNYAPDYETMLGIWKNVAANLSENGHLIAVVPPGTESPSDYMVKVEKARPLKKGEVSARIIGENDNGVQIETTASVEPVPVKFQAYHLKKSIYERAARDAGMNGEMEWRGIAIPEGHLSGALYAAFKAFVDLPHFNILVVAKSAV